MTTEVGTPVNNAEPTAEAIAAAKEVITSKIAPFGGKPAEAWTAVEAAFAAYPEKDSEASKDLAEARKTLTAFAGMFPDMLPSWELVNAACKKPAAARKPTKAANVTADGGLTLTPAQNANLIARAKTGIKYLESVVATLEGRTPEPIRNRGNDVTVATNEGAESNQGELAYVGDDEDAEQAEFDAAYAAKVAAEAEAAKSEKEGNEEGGAELDPKSAQALGVVPAAPVADGGGRKAPPSPEELAAVAAGGKVGKKK